MAIFLVFDTETEAQTANQTVFDTALPIYRLQGYDADAQGLIGKKNGVVNPSGGRTTAWDIPRQRLDGKWIVVDPATHPAAQTILPDGQKALDIMNAALGTVIREVDPQDGTWFAREVMS